LEGGEQGGKEEYVRLVNPAEIEKPSIGKEPGIWEYRIRGGSARWVEINREAGWGVPLKQESCSFSKAILGKIVS